MANSNHDNKSFAYSLMCLGLCGLLMNGVIQSTRISTSTRPTTSYDYVTQGKQNQKNDYLCYWEMVCPTDMSAPDLVCEKLTSENNSYYRPNYRFHMPRDMVCDFNPYLETHTGDCMMKVHSCLTPLPNLGGDCQEMYRRGCQFEIYCS